MKTNRCSSMAIEQAEAKSEPNLELAGIVSDNAVLRKLSGNGGFLCSA